MLSPNPRKTQETWRRAAVDARLPTATMPAPDMPTGGSFGPHNPLNDINRPSGDAMTATTSDAARPRGAFWPAFAALLGGALAMGVSPIFVRLADVGPFASAFYRVFLALPVLYAWMRVETARGARSARPVAALHGADRRHRAVLHGGPVLLASGDSQHHRRQRHLLRRHGAGLGGDLRLARLSPARLDSGAGRAGPLPPRRTGAHRPVLRAGSRAARR